MFDRRISLALVLAVTAAAPAAADAGTKSRKVPAPPSSGPVHTGDHARGRAPVTPGLGKIRLSKRKPAGGKIFGLTGTYDGRRGNLLQWVNYIYARNIPAMGGRFAQPTVYGEVAPTASIGCTGGVANAAYCSASNAIGWNRAFMLEKFNSYGDAAFAAILAHEYGHGAQMWLGFGYRGLFNRDIYREGFADCMAGGFMAFMYNLGHLDAASGTADYVEAYAAFSSMGGSASHGTSEWRTGLYRYGWQQGMQGCRNWGVQLASA